jgi:hypothetical protein
MPAGGPGGAACGMAAAGEGVAGSVPSEAASTAPLGASVGR